MKAVFFNRQEIGSFWAAGREFRLPLLFACVFVVLCSVILAVFWDETSFVTQSYHSVSLGMDMDTVDYVIGKPAQIGQGEQFKDYVQEKQADKYFNIYAYKIWKYPDGVTIIFNDGNKVLRIGCFGTAERNSCQPLLGLKIGDAEDLLIGKLGDGYESKIEDGRKVIYYPTLNGKFDLEKKKIVGLELTDMSELIRK